MSSATERLVDGDQVVGAPSLETTAEPIVSPEWHSLRLFGRGRGRHVGASAAGAEIRDEL